MKRRYKQLFCLAYCLCLFVLTGCWDSRNIGEIALEVGAALDTVDEESTEIVEQPRRKKFKLTLQNVPSSQGSSQNQESDTSLPKNYENIVEEGDTILEIFRNFSLEQDRSPFGQHLKVIVIGEDLAKRINLNLLLNLFTRSYEVRESCILLICQGRAEEALKTKKGIPAFELIGIQENRYKTAKLLPETTLRIASNKMASRSSFIIQSLVAEQGRKRFNGGAVIRGKDQKLVGFLGEREVMGLNWLTGEIKGGIVRAKDEKTKQHIIYDILSANSKIIPHVDGKRIWFDVQIESVGEIPEDWLLHADAFNESFIKQAERDVQKEVQSLVAQTLKKSQKEYRADVAGFGEQLRIHYPQVWQQVKSNWDETFSQLPIRCQVKITVDDYLIKGKKEL